MLLRLAFPNCFVNLTLVFGIPSNIRHIYHSTIDIKLDAVGLQIESYLPTCVCKAAPWWCGLVTVRGLNKAAGNQPYKKIQICVDAQLVFNLG